MQETYARVLARPRLIYGEDELGYLMRALRNTLVSQRRAASRRPATTELLDDAPLSAPASNDPAEAAGINEIYAAIAELPDEFRDALVAVDLVGLSYLEAARLLRVPEGTVTSRLFRARDRLARRLAGRRLVQRAAAGPARQGEQLVTRRGSDQHTGVTAAPPGDRERAVQPQRLVLDAAERGRLCG